MEISDREYKKLKKDADDNKQLVKIVTIIAVLIILIFGYFGYGRKAIDLHMQRQEADLQNEIALSRAKNNILIKEIEQQNMTLKEYFEWLDVRDELYSSNK